jgi:uncharacterized membrane protein (UPF0127 family)
VKNVGLKSGSWSVGHLVVAESFFERLRGVSLSAARQGILIQRSAVHTMGISYAIETVAVDREGRVVEVRTLNPNSFAWFRRAKYVLELPAGSPVPPVGSLVEVTDAG